MLDLWLVTCVTKIKAKEEKGGALECFLLDIGEKLFILRSKTEEVVLNNFTH